MKHTDQAQVKADLLRATTTNLCQYSAVHAAQLDMCQHCYPRNVKATTIVLFARPADRWGPAIRQDILLCDTHAHQSTRGTPNEGNQS